MVFTAGIFGVVPQAAQMVLMNICTAIYVSAGGLASVIPSIIGQQIGKGNLEEAKSYLSIIRISSSILFIGICGLVKHFDREIIGLLTNIPEVQREAASISYMLVFNAFPECLKVLQKGIVRAMGLQDKAVYIHLVGIYGLNLSL